MAKTEHAKIGSAQEGISVPVVVRGRSSKGVTND